MERDADEVDRLVAQWGAERPDLDLATMATVARLLNVGRRIDARLAAFARAQGVSVAEGDILFSLRRAGAPYRLSPSQLGAALLVPSGTLTSRLDRLEREGVIERVPHPTDRRSTEVQLTERGVELVDAAVAAHVEHEQRMLAPLTARDRKELDRLTRKLLDGLAALDRDEPPGRAS